jgi:transposase-like protein
MNSHKNAPLTRAELRLSKVAAARQFNTTPKTVAKWVEQFRAEGAARGSRDRSSRPNCPCRVCGDRGVASPASHR